MSLSTGRYQLTNAFKSLKAEWEGTDSVWRDVVRKDFEQAHWDPLAVRLSALLTAMDRLDQVMANVKSDCE